MWFWTMVFPGDDFTDCRPLFGRLSGYPLRHEVALFKKQTITGCCVCAFRQCDHGCVRDKAQTRATGQQFGDVRVAIGARCAAGSGGFDVRLFVSKDTTASSTIEAEPQLAEA